MATHTHIGYSRYTGYIHRARLYGHADYHGVVHAINAEQPGGALYDGRPFIALCGRSVIADSDYDGKFNVWPPSEGGKVTCKRCAKILASMKG